MLTIFALAISIMASTAQTPQDSDLGVAIRKASATSDDLWLLGESKKLVHFDRATGERTVVAEGVVDILEDRDHLWVASKTEGGGYQLTDARAPQNGARTLWAAKLVALVMQPEGVAGLGEDSLFQPASDETWTPVGLTEPVLEVGGNAVAGTRDGSTYFGVNGGEWGGSLRHIDNRTGVLSVVADVNVNAIVQDPANPSCVLYAEGLAHMHQSSGSVSRACGDDVTLVFQEKRPAVSSFDLPKQNWPMEGLVLLEDGWIAVSSERYFLYRQGHVVERPMPEVGPWSGLQISQPTDGALFVRSACCWEGGFNNYRQVLAVPIRP